MDLEHVLDTIAERIVSQGTRSEAARLETLAAATSALCPGVAEALVDWDGSEIARLRAFGIAHGALLAERASLRAEVLPGRGGVSAASVAA